MLFQDLKEGVTLTGLGGLLGSQKAAFTTGCYSKADGTITFYKEDTVPPTAGREPVIILPYQPGKLAKVLMAQTEVISGEFNGCIMAVYIKDSQLYANHVATGDSGDAKKAWTDEQSANFTMLSECKTGGMVGNFLGKKKNDLQVFMHHCVICVAVPLKPFPIFCAYVHRDNSGDYEVRKVEIKKGHA